MKTTSIGRRVGKTFDHSGRPTEGRNRHTRSRKEAVNSGETSSEDAVNRRPDRDGEDAEEMIARFTCRPANTSAGDGSVEVEAGGKSSVRHRREARRPWRLGRCFDRLSGPFDRCFGRRPGPVSEADAEWSALLARCFRCASGLFGACLIPVSPLFQRIFNRR